MEYVSGRPFAETLTCSGRSRAMISFLSFLPSLFFFMLSGYHGMQ